MTLSMGSGGGASAFSANPSTYSSTGMATTWAMLNMAIPVGRTERKRKKERRRRRRKSVCCLYQVWRVGRTERKRKKDRRRKNSVGCLSILQYSSIVDCSDLLRGGVSAICLSAVRGGHRAETFWVSRGMWIPNKPRRGS